MPWKISIASGDNWIWHLFACYIILTLLKIACCLYLQTGLALNLLLLNMWLNRGHYLASMFHCTVDTSYWQVVIIWNEWWTLASILKFLMYCCTSSDGTYCCCLYLCCCSPYRSSSATGNNEKNLIVSLLFVLRKLFPPRLSCSSGKNQRLIFGSTSLTDNASLLYRHDKNPVILT